MDWPSHCCFFSWPRPSFSWVNYGHRLTLPVWYYYWAGFFLHSCVPEWTMIGEHGPPHQKTFTWQLTLGEVRNISKWLFSKSLMLSFPVLNNWDWTKQEIGEECGGRAGCIDWGLLELLWSFPDDFIYFELFQMMLFTFNPSRLFYINFEPLQMNLFTLNPCRWWPSCRRSGSPSDPSRRKVEQATRDLDLEAGAVCTPLTCLHI